ncbi:MepB family protein [Flavobacterium terrae]|uniref:MepB protein n=1 Tax=Flavobacterium terrae TaxID=415425 RepID=A0A1M6EU77_9FLAO|nr:MepB family protein [Flavobacterium terrae]SHI89031.1 hypothetical protein SAMN05444363_1960 [Flavobacterium terrae]
MIITELKKIENLLFKEVNLKISNVIEDKESQEYFGYNFQTEKLNFKFRKAKITPKKVGQFVTLWKRNSQNITEPFNETDAFDFYIIATEEIEKFGFFLFPKTELIKRNILSTKLKEGKRGFRVYPSWTKTENKQAEKTQFWQIEFFIDFTKNDNEISEKIGSILNNKQFTKPLL